MIGASVAPPSTNGGSVTTTRAPGTSACDRVARDVASARRAWRCACPSAAVTTRHLTLLTSPFGPSVESTVTKRLSSISFVLGGLQRGAPSRRAWCRRAARCRRRTDRGPPVHEVDAGEARDREHDDERADGDEADDELAPHRPAQDDAVACSRGPRRTARTAASGARSARARRARAPSRSGSRASGRA